MTAVHTQNVVSHAHVSSQEPRRVDWPFTQYTRLSILDNLGSGDIVRFMYYCMIVRTALPTRSKTLTKSMPRNNGLLYKHRLLRNRTHKNKFGGKFNYTDSGYTQLAMLYGKIDYPNRVMR